jgi:peptidoglycan/xylan/chitin deacetylase (PgdA/CDA1 family)
MLIAKIPRLLRRTFRSLTWELPAGERSVYLTFDDGPTPEVTEWVLDKLDAYQARATFFCLGNNVEAHPGLFRKIQEKGHAVGNHSYSHIKGFRTSVHSYVEDVDKASGLIPSKLFRPPYGRIRPAQVRALKKKYRIIMWSVLSVDYDPGLQEQQVIRNVVENVRPGSVIVFHDSLKASKNLFVALPEVLGFLRREGYQAKVIT